MKALPTLKKEVALGMVGKGSSFAGRQKECCSQLFTGRCDALAGANV
jgi:hypothetical protein